MAPMLQGLARKTSVRDRTEAAKKSPAGMGASGAKENAASWGADKAASLSQWAGEEMVAASCRRRAGAAQGLIARRRRGRMARTPRPKAALCLRF